MTKKYSDSEKKDKKAALKEITEQLEKSIHEFMNGEKYKNFLNQMKSRRETKDWSQQQSKLDCSL